MPGTYGRAFQDQHRAVLIPPASPAAYSAAEETGVPRHAEQYAGRDALFHKSHSIMRSTAPRFLNNRLRALQTNSYDAEVPAQGIARVMLRPFTAGGDPRRAAAAGPHLRG